MRTAAAIGALVAGAVLIAGSASFAQSERPTISGEAIFNARCKSCHDPAIARAPNREQLRGETHDEIIAALTRGVMVPMAAGLSPVELTAVAEFLTGRPAPVASAPAPGRAGASGGGPLVAAPSGPPPETLTPSAAANTILSKVRPVTPPMLQRPDPADWLHWGRTYDGQNSSPLTRIDRGNVASLAPAWKTALPAGPSMPFPLVHDGVMFLQSSPDQVMALDATNGAVLWRYVHRSARPSTQKLGVALSGNRVVVPTSDLKVVALDIRTGAKVWEYELTLSAPATDKTPFQLRSSPLIVGNKVIQGVTSSRGPGGGYILALDATTGKETWRFHTIPRPGEVGGESWNGVPLDQRTGGSVWDQGTFDRDLNLIFFGPAPTYDTAPLLTPSGKPGTTNDALFTNATVALNADTGKLVWYFQHTPNDQWDLDWAFERTIATINIDGRPTKVVMTIGKQGILDVLDARTGKYLYSLDSGMQNITASIDPVTGRKNIDPTKIPNPNQGFLVCPGPSGSRAWPPTSVNQRAGKLFVQVAEWCVNYGVTRQGTSALLSTGVSMGAADHPDAAKDGKFGRLQVMDLNGKKLGWSTDLDAPISAAVLSTAGGVVFAGDLDPSLKAFDDRDGKLLWTGKLDAYPSSNLITYSVGQTQYVAVVVGMSNNMVSDLSRRYVQFRRARNLAVPQATGGPAVVVFALPRR